VCSVLFCDVAGFTPLSESRDPEAVRELLSGYFEVARTIIGRYGGVVEKFIGDAVMAVWGTPTATEGDPERAVRAALDLVAAVAQLGVETGVPELAARAGVVTGEVAGRQPSPRRSPVCATEALPTTSPTACSTTPSISCGTVRAMRRRRPSRRRASSPADWPASRFSSVPTPPSTLSDRYGPDR
jgi:hypothetical protein